MDCRTGWFCAVQHHAVLGDAAQPPALAVALADVVLDDADQPHALAAALADAVQSPLVQPPTALADAVQSLYKTD